MVEFAFVLPIGVFDDYEEEQAHGFGFFVVGVVLEEL